MNRKFRLVILLCIFVNSVALLAQTNPGLRSIYDEAGNLVGTLDTNGNATAYEVDAKGRLMAFERLTARDAVDIFFIEPTRNDAGVRPGTAVTIHGVRFSATPAENQVAFNGVAANVEESTTMLIRTRVPAGARTGPVQVTAPMGTAVSRRPFKINSCLAPPAGLVSWWPGDGHGRDLVGGNFGARQGTAAYAPGRVSHAFSFDGADGVVSVVDRPALNPGAANFTVDFWMKPTPPNRWRALLNKRAGCGGVSYWAIRLLPEGLLSAELAAAGADSYEIISTTPVNDGNWHHVALVRQGATATLYIDGQARGSVNTKSVLDITNAAPLRIGNDPCVGIKETQVYQGLIDEVDWFNRALAPAEIQSIIDAGESGKCKPE